MPAVVVAAALVLLTLTLLERRPSMEGTRSPTSSSSPPPGVRSSLPVPPEALEALEANRRRDSAAAKAPNTFEARRARIDASPHFSEKEKAALRADLADTVRIVEEADRRAQADAAELERDLARAALEQAALPARAPTRLRLEVDRLDGGTILPFRPLIVNLRLVNAGGREAAVSHSLAPEHGALKAAVRMPGSPDFWDRPLTAFSGGPAVRRTLGVGATETYQTDLFLELGVHLDTKALMPGEYTVRLSLPAPSEEEAVAAEFPVRVVAPQGNDREVLDRIIAGRLQAYLGTKGLSAGRLSCAREDVGKAVSEAETLCRDFPESSYARDLRIGTALAMETFRNVLAPTPEAAIDLEARLKRLWSEIGRRDKPQSWARAEILPLMAIRARGPVPDLGSADDFLARFRLLCPADPRARP